MPTDFISLRKDQLRYQMSKAIELDNQEQLFCLRSQWVHRHGIETLHEAEEKELVEPLNDLELSSEITLEEVKSLDQEIPLSNEEEIRIDEVKTFDDELVLVKNDENISELSDKGSMPTSEEEIKKTSNGVPIFIVPPPVPALNHLRRWVPSIEKQIPKAS